MDVVAEQQPVEVLHVRVVGKHDVAGVIEREAGILDRAAPSADLRFALEHDAAGAVVIGRRQAGRARAQDHARGTRDVAGVGRRVVGGCAGSSIIRAASVSPPLDATSMIRRISRAVSSHDVDATIRRILADAQRRAQRPARRAPPRRRR